jgi:hypothetical protein
MGTRINRRSLIVIGGAIAVLSTGAAVTVADSNPTNLASIPRVAADQSAVAVWADANGLTGLSPAALMLGPLRSGSLDHAAVTVWANTNGLTGLSPAGLTVAPVRSDYQSEIRTWADANGLSGLSPASLSRIGD